MNASGATGFSSDNEDFPLHFGEWLKRRRQELDLTQEQLAKRASCSVFAIRKMESGERNPSRQLARMLAPPLEISSENHDNFIKAARGELSLERLASLARTPARASQPGVESGQPPINLPRALTPFIGREPELAALGQLLENPQCSLITLVGPGGIGKTRLAIEAANQHKDSFPDGVSLVQLAALKAPALIVPAIADAIHFRSQNPADPQTQLLRYLCKKRILLILDNAEHLLEGVGLFADILEACPGVKLLVTSRERLNLLSEWAFEIMGLPVPPSEREEQFDSYSSVALFLQSARRVRAGFELQAEERSWILRLCQLIKGMPLGIELSAAWVGLLSCEEIVKEIERNIDFLTVSMRDLPQRHRSLRATIDHSWNLLNAEEKLLLSRLSVFRGSFRLEAAKVICGASLDVLSSLRNKMLLYRTDPDFYSLHELVRQYAELKLRSDPVEDEQVKDRHSSYYVHCLEEWEKALKSPRQLETFDEMAPVIDNLSLGWQRMLTHCQPGTGKSFQLCADALHRSLFSLSLFYEMRCRSWEAVTLFTESVEYLKSIQNEFEITEERCYFISVLGHISAYLGLHLLYVLKYPQACAYLEEAIQLLAQSQSWVERAQAQIMLAAIYYRQGHYLKSAVLHEQARDAFKEAGGNWWYLLSLINLARTYLPLRKIQEAEGLCQQGFQLLEKGNMRLELPLMLQFANARYLQHDYVQAEQVMLNNLQLSHQYRNDRMTANIYIDLSKVMLDTDRVELAEKYLQESIKLLSEFGESDDLAFGLIYVGKCFLARSDIEAARKAFRQVTKIGLTLNIFYFVYWGLVNIARLYLLEGQVEKALEISRVLIDCTVENKIVQNEGNCFLADLKALLPEDQFETAMQQTNEPISVDGAQAAALAYALANETG